MFEHVGAARYREFFGAAAKLLKPDGVMLLHSIGRYGPPAVTNPWIAKYIFPGGYIPALSEVMKAVEHVGLLVTDMEILRLHYADTLKAWRERFREQWDAAAEIYDERFCRMWDFYLAGSEAAFRTGDMMVFQLQLTKDNERAADHPRLHVRRGRGFSRRARRPRIAAARRRIESARESSVGRRERRD